MKPRTADDGQKKRQERRCTAVTTKAPYRCTTCIPVIGMRPRVQDQIPQGWRRQKSPPYVDCWRLTAESGGELYSPDLGVPAHEWCTATCRWDDSHHEVGAHPECWCGYYAVTEGGYPALSQWFPTFAAKYGRAGLWMMWAGTRADVNPVFMRIRLYNPFTYAIPDTEWAAWKNGTVWRGTHFEVTGPLYVADVGSAARLKRRGYASEVVRDLPAVIRDCVAR